MNDLFELVENTPNDMELGKKVRELYLKAKEVKDAVLEKMEGKFILESPDGGKTVTQRPFGGDVSTRVVIKSESHPIDSEIENPSV